MRKRQTSKIAIAELFNKITNKKKSSNKQFFHRKANIFCRESYKIYKFSNKY